MFSLSSSSSSSFPPGLPYLLEVRVSYPGSAVAYYCSPGHRVEVGQGPLLPCLQDSAHGCCEHSVRYNNTSRGGNPLRHNLHHHRLTPPAGAGAGAGGAGGAAAAPLASCVSLRFALFSFFFSLSVFLPNGVFISNNHEYKITTPLGREHRDYHSAGAGGREREGRGQNDFQTTNKST